MASNVGILGQSVSNLGNDFKTLGKLTLAGAAGLVALATKSAFSAARIEELTFALQAIAKANDVSSDAAMETVQSLRGFNIAHQQALEITSLFIQSQLDLSDAMKIATAAKDLAVIASMDSSEATKTLTYAIVAQRPLILRQFGIVTTLNDVYEKYAEKVGKTASELTEVEKKQAFLNVVLEAGEKVSGTYDAAMGSVSKRFRSLTGRILPDFIAEVGKAFSPALTVIIDAISNAIEKMGNWLKENKDTVAGWGEKLGEIATKGIEFLGKLFEFIINNKEIILGVLVALGAAVGIFIGAFVIAHAAIIVIILGIVAIVTFLAKAWNENFLGIRDRVTAFVEFLKGAWELIKTVIGKVVDWLQGTVLPFFKNWFEQVQNWLLYYMAVFQFAWAIIKDVVGIVVDWFMSHVAPKLKSVFESIKGFLNTLAQWFFDKWTYIKMSIVLPIVDWFMTYVYPTIESTFNDIKGTVTELYNKFKEKFDEIKTKVEEVINSIKETIDKFKPKIEIGLELPNVEEAWNNLKAKAHEAGVPGFQTGGIVPGPIGTPTPIMAHGGEKVIPAGVGVGASAGGGTINFHVSIGLYAGTETEKRNIARDLYAALAQVARSQNKTVAELMNA